MVHFTLHSPHLRQPPVLLTSPPEHLSTPALTISRATILLHMSWSSCIPLTSPLLSLLNSVLFTEADCFLCLKTFHLTLRGPKLSGWPALQPHLSPCVYLASMPQLYMGLLYAVHTLHAPSYHWAFAHAIPAFGIAPLILYL